MPRPWDRRPDEPLDAYVAFVAYCQMKPSLRSIEMVAGALKSEGGPWRSVEQLEDWKHFFRWKERSAAWDADLARRHAPSDLSPSGAMSERHRREAQALQQILIQRLRQFHYRELDSMAIARWLDVSVRIEKEANDVDAGDDEGERRREFLDCLLADPEACDLAGKLVERLASSFADSGGAGVVGDAEGVEICEAPGETRPPAG